MSPNYNHNGSKKKMNYIYWNKKVFPEPHIILYNKFKIYSVSFIVKYLRNRFTLAYFYLEIFCNKCSKLYFALRSFRIVDEKSKITFELGRKTLSNVPLQRSTFLTEIFHGSGRENGSPQTGKFGDTQRIIS